jgi:hypothetical protein
MDVREIVDAYLQGRLESWGVYRKLVKLGLSTATAIAVVSALPAAVQAQSPAPIGEVAHSEQESPLLDKLMSQLAKRLARVEDGGKVQPLARTLANIGLNNANLANASCNKRVPCAPVQLNFNDGVNTNLTGELRPDFQGRNMQLNLNGNLGQTNVNLVGTLDPPRANNLNIQRVNLNVSGNIGQTNVNLNGNLRNIRNNNNTNVP